MLIFTFNPLANLINSIFNVESLYQLYYDPRQHFLILKLFYPNLTLIHLPLGSKSITSCFNIFMVNQCNKNKHEALFLNLQIDWPFVIWPTIFSISCWKTSSFLNITLQDFLQFLKYIKFFPGSAVITWYHLYLQDVFVFLFVCFTITSVSV